MNDQEHTDGELKKFYRERLIPLAEIANNTGVEFFPEGPDRAADTYFTEHTNDGSYLHEFDAGNLKAELQKLWANDEFPEIAELCKAIADLASVLKEKESSDDEISPFIYAMF